MKREFLENIKVGDTPLTKEAVDLIMGEYGKGIEAEKAKFADYDNLKKQLDEANNTIKSYKDMDIDGIKKSAADWETKYNTAIAEHEKEKAEAAFMGKFKAEAQKRKARNCDAVIGVIGNEKMNELRKSTEQEKDICKVFDDCQKENEYLFGGETPPRYSGRTGTGNGGAGNGKDEPKDLSEALRERYL